MLPILLDDSEPPEPLNTVAYLRWSTTSPREIARTIKERRRLEIENSWLTVEEVTEVLSDALIVGTVLEHTLTEVIGCTDEIQSLRLCALGLTMAATHVTEAVRSYFEFLIFFA